VLLVNGTVSGLTMLGMGFITPQMAAQTVSLPLYALLFVAGVTRSMPVHRASARSRRRRSEAAEQLGELTVLDAAAGSLALGVALGRSLLRVQPMVRGSPAEAVTLADFRLAFVLIGLLGSCQRCGLRGCARRRPHRERSPGQATSPAD